MPTTGFYLGQACPQPVPLPTTARYRYTSWGGGRGSVAMICVKTLWTQVGGILAAISTAYHKWKGLRLM